MLLRRAKAISSSVGSGLVSSRAFPAITMPGMQNPHWTAPASPKAQTQASFSKSVRPSTVRTLFPSILSVVRTQARVAFPSTSTVQVPQAPSLQPSFTLVRRSSSRR